MLSKLTSKTETNLRKTYVGPVPELKISSDELLELVKRHHSLPDYDEKWNKIIDFTRPTWFATDEIKYK